MTITNKLEDQPNSIPCPNCGRKMRLNHSTWKEPKYVCDSYRKDNDCGMILMFRHISGASA